MGKRENKVEDHLHKSIEKLGGTTRKWVSPGRAGVPDRIVIPGKHRSGLTGVFFCEVKTFDGDWSDQQLREHKRLRESGATVVTVFGHHGVDALIEELQLNLGKLMKQVYK